MTRLALVFKCWPRTRLDNLFHIDDDCVGTGAQRGKMPQAIASTNLCVIVMVTLY